MTSLLALVLLQAAPGPGTIAITNVTVIDGSDSTGRRDQTVIIRGNRIAVVGPASSTPVPDGARVLPGEDRYLIPGLWDMHVHTDVPRGREVLRLYVLNGVLSVRDLAGAWDRLAEWRRDVASGALVGPRLLLSGPYLEGGESPVAHLLVRTTEEARAAVDSLARLGVDVVKLHGQMAPAIYFAAARAARERGLRVAGHVPRTITPWQASDSGVGSLEHLLQIPVFCTPAESLALAPRYPVQTVVGRCSSADQSPLFTQLVRNGTRVVPTMTAAYEVALWPRRNLPGEAFAGRLPDTLRTFIARIFPIPPDVPAGAEEVGLALFDKRLALVGRMHRAGVVILPGTDAPLRNSPPGFGLHAELAWMASAGMSPFQILRAATLEPARYFGMLDSLGAIGQGKLADLVLLRENPLLDIRHTRTIEAIIADGRLILP